MIGYIRRTRKKLHKIAGTLTKEYRNPRRDSLAVGLGVFIGVLPIYGFQIIVCLGLARILKLNRVIMVAAAHISLPFIAPFLIAAGIGIGETIRYGKVRWPSREEGVQFIETLSLWTFKVPDLFLSCFLGDLLLGLVLGVFFGGLSYIWFYRKNAP